MRLLVYGADSALGGTEKYLLTLYGAIDKSKIQFDFLFNHDAGEIPYAQEILTQGGKIYNEYFMLRDRHKKNYITVKELFDCHPEWSGVYVNLQNIHSAYRLLVEAARRNLPYRMIHIHSSGYQHLPTLKQKIFEIFFHLTKKKVVTHFLACSTLASQWGYHNKDAVIIPNAVDFKEFARNRNKREEMRKRYDIGYDEIVMGYCGGLRIEKNPEFLIEIFARFCDLIPNARLLIVGKGKEEEACRELSKRLKVVEKIIFAGEVNNVSDFMQMMDCFVLPSRYEGFGIVLLEAQAAGLPCFTTKDVVPKETNVTGRVTFLPAEGSAIDWATAITEKGFEWEDKMDCLESSKYTISAMRENFMNIFTQEDGSICEHGGRDD